MRLIITLIIFIISLSLFSQDNDWRSKYANVYGEYEGYHIVSNKKNLLGLVDINGVEIIAPSFKELTQNQPNDAIMAASIDGKKWGYINTNGEVIVPFLYEKTTPFSNGRGVIFDNYKSAMVNTNGRVIIPFIYDVIEPVKDGYVEVITNSYYNPKSKRIRFIGGRHGIVDTIGKIIVPCNYEDIGDITDGIAKFKINGLWGLIDVHQNKIILNPICREIDDFQLNGMAQCLVYDRWVYVDQKGRLIREVEGRNTPRRPYIPVDKYLVETMLTNDMVLVNVARAKKNKCSVLPLNGDYYIGKTEVTFQFYEMFLDDTGYVTDMKKNGYDKSVEKLLDSEIDKSMPVYNVTWKDCIEFCFWLSSITDKLFYLPDESEWEYAARGGINAQNSKYAGSDDINAVAWYNANSKNTCWSVAQKEPNELGLYDMSGNVWEWCRNLYERKTNMDKTLSLDIFSSDRAIRGGGYINDRKSVEVDYRLGYKPREVGAIGFRLVYYPQ